MKPFLVLSLVAMAPVAGWAQTGAPAQAISPRVSTEPAAQLLLDSATATYQVATGLRFQSALEADGQLRIRSSVALQKPNFFRVQITQGAMTARFQSDGAFVYAVQSTTYRKLMSAQKEGAPFIGLIGLSGQFIGSMLQGTGPLTRLQTMWGRASMQNFSRRTVLVAPQLPDSASLRGVKSSITFTPPGRTQPVNYELTMWFNDANLLQRVDGRVIANGTTQTFVERVTEQQLNPTFAPGTWKFDTTGLKPAAQSQEAAYFDPRLKVGARPFAFSAKALNGQTISPARYQGKVLLMDFWATWCGPCVASLPELRATYNKYHPKGLEVVSISLDEDKSALTSFIKENKMPWPQVFDGKGWQARVPRLYGVTAIPFVLLVGRDGKIAAVNSRDDLEGAVKKALAAKG